MGILNYFKKQSKSSAQQAKERLQILIAHERALKNPAAPSYLPDLKQDILAVIRNYVEVSDHDVDVQYEEGYGCDVLELNISLPERDQ
ncbi:MAG: cell division topological specificity factor MinE [bacterium]